MRLTGACGPRPRPGAPRQWKVMIGPLSSIRTRSARSSGVSRSRAKRLAPRLLPALNASATRGVRRCPGSSSSAPCEARVRDPADAHEPPHVGRRAARDAGHAARSGATAAPSSRDVSSGTWASSARSTIGASVPSTSKKSAERSGSAVTGEGPPRRAVVCPGAPGRHRHRRRRVLGPLRRGRRDDHRAAARALARVRAQGGHRHLADRDRGDRRAGRGRPRRVRQRGPRRRAFWSPLRPSPGVLAGTALQQRISERAVAGAFVVLLVVSAAVLVF